MMGINKEMNWWGMASPLKRWRTNRFWEDEQPGSRGTNFPERETRMCEGSGVREKLGLPDDWGTSRVQWARGQCKQDEFGDGDRGELCKSLGAVTNFPFLSCARREFCNSRHTHFWILCNRNSRQNVHVEFGDWMGTHSGPTVWELLLWAMDADTRGALFGSLLQ